jgi:hypothetical protein
MNPNTILQWAALAESAQPLIAAGEVLAGDIVGLFKSKNPDATNEELNAALGVVVDQATAEIAAINQEESAVGQAPAPGPVDPALPPAAPADPAAG